MFFFFIITVSTTPTPRMATPKRPRPKRQFFSEKKSAFGAVALLLLFVFNVKIMDAASPGYFDANVRKNCADWGVVTSYVDKCVQYRPCDEHLPVLCPYTGRFLDAPCLKYM